MNKMHAFVFILIGILFSFAVKAATTVESVFVDTVNDCVVVSSATEDSPIDFYESECKAFGGYKLHISGSDLRYGPALSYRGSEIDLQRPPSFHDMAESSIEWLYEREADDMGVGKIQWRGLLYSLDVSSEENSRAQYYGVKLQGRKSCVVAIVDNKETARKAVLDPNSACK